MNSVDVIVPCYRYGHFLRACVESVLMQQGVASRVLILDDASPDDTEEIGTQLASEDSRVTFRRHVANRGHIATYNEGTDWACADYVLLLSADDYLLPGALARATALLDRHRGAGFAFGTAISLSDSGHKRLVIPPASLLNRTKDDVLEGARFIELSGARNLVRTPTAVVRTELQKRVGGYREQLPHSGDMEMWLRLAAHASVGVVIEAQAVYREHSRRMSEAYCKDHGLEDLRQRQAALEWFLIGCRDRLTDPDTLHRRLMWSLGNEAVGSADRAFHAGESALSLRLLQFAKRVCPDIEGSWSWRKLGLKRRIGLERWSALKTFVAISRRMVSVRDRGGS